MFTRVRIDATLRPLDPPYSPVLEEVVSDISSGVFDHLSPRRLEDLLSMVTRTNDLLVAEFNDHLNRMLVSYGMHVIPTTPDGDEVAVAMVGNHASPGALASAHDLRDMLYPAALATYTGLPSLENVLRAHVEHLTLCACA